MIFIGRIVDADNFTIAHGKYAVTAALLIEITFKLTPPTQKMSA